MLASLLFPYDDDAPKKIDSWMAELSKEGCIQCYESNSSHYIQILNWLNHQKIDHPSKSKIPEFDESSRILANDSRSLALARASLGPKDQGSKEGKGEDQEFLIFWEKFPRQRRGGREDSLSAWRKAIKRSTPEEILNGLETYIGSDDVAAGFASGAAKWLNQSGWANTYSPPKGTDGFRRTAEPQKRNVITL
jgi:hypothetical protein